MRGEVWQDVTWLANCGSFPQQVNPTVRLGTAGIGQARQGLFKSWWRFPRIVWLGQEWRGTAGFGTARFFLNLTGNSET
jgi:hypothetical protein